MIAGGATSAAFGKIHKKTMKEGTREHQDLLMCWMFSIQSYLHMRVVLAMLALYSR